MKHLLLCLSGILIVGCADTPPTAPPLDYTDAQAQVDANADAKTSDIPVPIDIANAPDVEDTTSGAIDALVDTQEPVTGQEDTSDSDLTLSDVPQADDTITNEDASADAVSPSVPTVTLCAPCTNDSECTDAGDEFCARLESDFSACSRPCGDGCPDDFECGTTTSLNGEEIQACIPNAGACSCTDEYVGEETLCWSTNAAGSCQGSTFCTAEGWGSCSASTPAPEVCGGGDENCDGTVDEEGAAGCFTLYADVDDDGFGNPLDSKCLCAESGDYNVIVGGDCNDLINAVSPIATEVCNELDDDCDKVTDPDDSAGCETFYFDEDGDGWGKTSESICACAPSGKYTSTKPGDCTDTNADVNPDQPCGPPVCNIFILSGGCPAGPCGTPDVGAPCPNALVCATPSKCRTACATNSHCQPGFYCSDTVCVADKPNGAPCSLNAECASQYCGNGFCCSGGGQCCDGTAAPCNDSNPCTSEICNDDFTCSYINNTASCGEQSCDGLTFKQPGTCANGECNQTETLCTALDDPCQAAACDPDAGCGLVTLEPGDVCEANACIGFELYETKTCDAQGECTGGGATVACPDAFICAPDGSPQCATSCIDDQGCQPDSFCNASACEEKKLDGETCTGDNECKSDSCQDGICCGGCCDFGTLGTNQYSRAAEICEGHNFEGKGSCARVISSFGNFAPGDIAPMLNDSAFVQLSTGVASQIGNQQQGENQNTNGPDPDNTVNIAYDLCGFTVNFTAPAGVQGFAFDFIFFSSEYPEWVGTQYNDSFNVMMTSDLYDNQNIAFDNTGAPISINVAFFDICNGAGCTTPGSALAGTGYNGGIGGSTGWLTTTVPISAGEEFTLRFVIYDEGDPIFDSDVLINNFRWLEFVSGTGPVTE